MTQIPKETGKYVTSTSPGLFRDIKFIGSCQTGENFGLTLFSNVQWAGGYVTSWRGPKPHKRARHLYNHNFSRERWMIENPYARSITRTPNGFVDGFESHWIYKWNFQPKPDYFYSRPLDYGVSVLDENRIKVLNWLAMELYGKAKAPDINLAVLLAELPETIHYLGKRLFDVLKAFQSFNDLAKLGKSATPHSAWLEFRYAIMPMILDIESIIDLYVGGQRRLKVTRKYKQVTEKRSQVCSTSFDNACVPKANKPLTWGYRVTTETKYRGAGALLLKSLRPKPDFGTSFSDVIAAAWEVVPLSFVFDWFVDVGGWLASVRDVTISIAGGYTTFVIEGSQTCTLHNTKNCEIVSTDPMVTYAYGVQRIANPTIPSLPLVNAKALSLLRRIDGAALSVGTILRFLARWHL